MVENKQQMENDDFFDFNKDILKDLTSQGFKGQELIRQLSRVKRSIPVAMDKLIEDAEQETVNSRPMSKGKFEQAIDL